MTTGSIEPTKLLSADDKRALARAVAETFNHLIEGYARQGFEVLSYENVEALLYYNINPWCTDASFEMLEGICNQLKGMRGQ